MRIDDIVNLILDDYEGERTINKIDIYNQPDKEAIANVINKLMKILYPGYYSDKVYKIYSLKNNMSATIEDVIFHLNKQIAIVLKYCEVYPDMSEAELDDMAKELSQEENLVFLCGHYEGIDKRVLDKIVTDEVSIGDFVLTGGELPAMMMIDAISRLIPGVLNNDISAETESFTDNLLEYPQYTRPEVWEGEAVPAVLLSGHHANIEKWRREQSLLITKERRPDLFEKAQLTKKDKKFLAECE